MARLSWCRNGHMPGSEAAAGNKSDLVPALGGSEHGP